MIRFPRTLAVLVVLVALHGSAFAQGCQAQTSAGHVYKPLKLDPADLPPLPAPIPDRPFATVPDNPADHLYKPLRLDPADLPR